jgi:hypothetical protein
MAQGYYVSRPLAPERVVPWLAAFSGERRGARAAG